MKLRERWHTTRACLLCAAVVLLLVTLCVAPYRVRGSSMNKHATDSSTHWVLATRAWLTRLMLPVCRHVLYRGAIVIYEVPMMPGVNSAKRIMALPGDTIEVSPEGISVNASAVMAPHEARGVMTGLLDIITTATQHAVAHKIIDTRKGDISWQVANQASSCDIARFLHEQTIYDYARLVSHQFSSNGYLSHVTITVPRGAYFVLGDNASSYDSRYHGFVPESQVRFYVVLSF